MDKLDMNKKLDIEEILQDLENYHPLRKGWTWREPDPDFDGGPFHYEDCSKPLKKGVPLMTAH
jgi:D-ornithine 4,5-aminomutase subunit beta